MYEVVPALASYILSRKSIIDAHLQPFDLHLAKVNLFESQVNDVLMYPLIEIGNGTVKKEWVAAPHLIQLHYTIEINGYLLLEDTDLNAQAIRAFAAGFSLLFEDFEGQTIPVDNKPYSIHYHSEPPLEGYDLSYSFIGGAFLRSFHTTWSGYITRTTWMLPQESWSNNSQSGG